MERRLGETPVDKASSIVLVSRQSSFRVSVDRESKEGPGDIEY